MEEERNEGQNGGFAMVPKAGSGLIAVAQQREIAEVQSKMIVARMNPRSKKLAQDRIVQNCCRVSLAEKAMYSYARGGTDITDASIRLAEVMAQNWGNFEFGIRELEQRDGESSVEAYAWDLETNVSQRKTFQVPHIRYSKGKRNVKLSDPRDIYEMVANLGARRMRACILGVIPGDVKEAAVHQCEETLKTKIKITPERIQNMVKMFGELGVSQEMIESRIQRHIDAVTPALVVQLTKIYNSLKDGMSTVGDWFGPEKPGPETGSLSVDDLKSGKEENRGHGNEGLDQVGKKTETAKSPETPAETQRRVQAEREAKKGKKQEPASTGTLPLNNPEYGDKEEGEPDFRSQP